MARVVTVFVAALALAASAFGATITRTETTATYKFTLDVGPLETMYTTAQVKAKHPTTGEEMVGATMDMGGMAMGSGNRHLEVHVHLRSSGAVADVGPSSITLTDTTAMGMPDKISVVGMEGIGEGKADLHYGNNVKLTAGHMYKVVAVVRGEKATFTFRA